jgi:hypothetical protein
MTSTFALIRSATKPGRGSALLSANAGLMMRFRAGLTAVERRPNLIDLLHRLRSGGDRRKGEPEHEDEPDPPHWHLGWEWLAGV